MVVRDFYFVSIGSPPYEANSVLIVDSYAVLSLPVAMQFLQPVSERDLQVVQHHGAVEHHELSFRDTSGRRTPWFARSPDFRRLLVGETLDHFASITEYVNNVNRYVWLAGQPWTMLYSLDLWHRPNSILALPCWC